MLGYLSLDIICSSKLTVFLELHSRKTIRFSEQIMSKDKYPSIFSQPNWDYCVYYPSVLKIGEYPRIFLSFSWGIFAHVTRLDQSRASENIWCIIKEIKTAPSALLSYINTREFLRTREKNREARAEGECFSHLSFFNFFYKITRNSDH